MGGGLGRFLQGVEGAGADVAVDDTKRAERGCCRELTGMAGGCNWRDCQRDQVPVCDETPQIAMGVLGENLRRYGGTVSGNQARFRTIDLEPTAAHGI